MSLLDNLRYNTRSFSSPSEIPSGSFSNIPLRPTTSNSILAHADDTDLMSWEGMTIWKAMMAGSAAGVIEHACMFPIDTIKTRMQSVAVPGQPAYTSVVNSIRRVVQEEGPLRLYRGLGAVALAAAPSHAMYFGGYEITKRYMGGSRTEHTPLASVCAGIVATLSHDAISTPMDVVKQRMQLYNSEHRRIRSTVAHILKHEGPTAFYRSYVATCLLNVPYISIHFLMYETMHTLFHGTKIDDTPIADIISGSIAAACGAFVSNPLDVVKTRIQTSKIDPKTFSTAKFVYDMYKKEGLGVFARGVKARVVLYVPSAAICWTVYEGVKRILKTQPKPDHHHHHHHHHQ